MADNTRAHNATVAWLIKNVAPQLALLGSFGAEMVALEAITAGVIASACIRHNRQPDQAADAFCEGMKAQLTAAIYGKQQ